MAQSGAHILVVILTVLFPTTFFGTYLAAVWLGDVEAEFPYISDAASSPPESCVFGQFINIGAVLLCICIYIRYCEICQYDDEYQISPKARRLNKWSLWFGILSCLGLSIVANFQESNVIYVHFFGACMCFGFGTAYFWIQSLCSYHIKLTGEGVALANFRVALSFCCTVFFIISIGTGITSHIQFHGKNPRKWYPDDGGWVMHVISTASEWVVAICFCIYILSFYREFSLISFTHPQLCLDTSRIPSEERSNLVSSPTES